MRGARPGPPPVPEEEMSNNVILRKLKIAFNLRSEEMIEVFGLVDRKLSLTSLVLFLESLHSFLDTSKGNICGTFSWDCR